MVLGILKDAVKSIRILTELMHTRCNLSHIIARELFVNATNEAVSIFVLRIILCAHQAEPRKAICDNFIVRTIVV